MKKSILFVDDEPKILDGLGRMLRNMRQEWDMHFCGGGREALAMMAEQPVDLVVSDMRMPEMNGLEFLAEVRNKYPTVIRIVLSGYADQLLVVRSVGIAHQYLAKPCAADTLRSTVARALNLRALLSNDGIKNLISRLSALPSLPALYAEVAKELQSPDASIRRVGEIISKDPSMTAKVLQLVNSAFFGIRRAVSSPVDAAVYLGLETIHSLVLSLHAFAKFETTRIPGCSIDQIWNHSVAVGLLAKRIMKGENAGIVQVEAAFTAGLLHDLGKLVLASNLPQECEKVIAICKTSRATLQEAELDVHGSTHAEVGAYLLGLWGLPDPIVEAVAMHHRPGESVEKIFSPLSAVHAADALEAERHVGRVSRLDFAYFDVIGKADSIEKWRDWRLEVSPRGSAA